MRKMESRPMQSALVDIMIKTLDGQNHTFSVPEDLSVRQFKEKISSSVEISADIQRLIYQGRAMQDNDKLSKYDIHGKAIHLVQRAPPTTASSLSTANNTSTSSARPQAGGNVLDFHIGMNFNLGIVQGEKSTSEARARMQQVDFNLEIINNILRLLKGTLPLPGGLAAEGSERTSAAAAAVNIFERSRGNQPSRSQNTNLHLTPVELADQIDQVIDTQTRMLCCVRQYQNLLRNNEGYLPDSREAQKAQKVIDSMNEIFHALGHTWHNLSDVTMSMSSRMPREAVAPSLVPFQRPGVSQVPDPHHMNGRARQGLNRSRQRAQQTSNATHFGNTTTPSSTDNFDQTDLAGSDKTITEERTITTSGFNASQNITASGVSEFNVEVFPTVVTQEVKVDPNITNETTKETKAGNANRSSVDTQGAEPPAQSTTRTTQSATGSSQAKTKTTKKEKSSQNSNSTYTSSSHSTTTTITFEPSGPIPFGPGMSFPGANFGNIPFPGSNFRDIPFFDDDDDDDDDFPEMNSDFFQNMFGSFLNSSNRPVNVSVVQEVKTKETSGTSSRASRQQSPSSLGNKKKSSRATKVTSASNAQENVGSTNIKNNHASKINPDLHKRNSADQATKTADDHTSNTSTNYHTSNRADHHSSTSVNHATKTGDDNATSMCADHHTSNSADHATKARDDHDSSASTDYTTNTCQTSNILAADAGINTSQASSTNTSQASSTNTSQASSTNTSQARSTNTSQAISTNTSQASTTNTSQASSTNTSQASSTNTSQDSSTNTSQAISTNTSQASSTNTSTIPSDHASKINADHHTKTADDHTSNTSTDYHKSNSANHHSIPATSANFADSPVINTVSKSNINTPDSTSTDTSTKLANNANTNPDINSNLATSTSPANNTNVYASNSSILSSASKDSSAKPSHNINTIPKGSTTKVSTSTSNSAPSQSSNEGSRAIPPRGVHRTTNVSHPFLFNVGPAGQGRQQSNAIIDPYLPCASHHYTSWTAKAAATVTEGESRSQSQVPNLSDMVSGVVGDILGQASRDFVSTRPVTNTSNISANTTTPSSAPTTASPGSGHPSTTSSPSSLPSQAKATTTSSGQTNCELFDLGTISNMSQARTGQSASSVANAGDAATSSPLAKLSSQCTNDSQERLSDAGVVGSVFNIITYHLELPDLLSLRFGNFQPLNRVREPLEEFVKKLVGQHGSIERTVDAVLSDVSDEIKLFLDKAEVNDDIDFAGSVNNCLRAHLILIVAAIQSGTMGFLNNFGACLQSLLTKMLADLLALCVYSIDGGWPVVLYLLNIFLSRMINSLGPRFARLMNVSLNGFIEEFYHSHLMPESDILDNIVKRNLKPLLQKHEESLSQTFSSNATAIDTQASAPVVIPADLVEDTSLPVMKSPDAHSFNVPNVEQESSLHQLVEKAEEASVSLLHKVQHPDTLVMVSTQKHDDVEKKSEAWHSVVPQEWISVINQDIHKQQEQKPQSPLSDAYLQGLSTKQRKIMSLKHAHGIGNTSQYLCDSLKRAAKTAGVTPQSSDETIAQDVAEDSGLQVELEKEIAEQLESRLVSDTDFSFQQFPNAYKYFL